jgi:cytochrome c-type biogenesis protein CcmF
VLVGTLYPLVLEAITGDKISVGEPFFNLTFGALMVPLLLVVPFGPLLAWKRGDVFAAAQRLYIAAGVALTVGIGSLALAEGVTVLAAFGIGLAAWLMIGAMTDLAVKAGIGHVSPSVALRRLVGLPRSVFGTSLAHFGLGLTTLGIVATGSLEIERIVAMQPGDTVEVSGYSLRFQGLTPHQGPNYTEDVGGFQVSRGGVRVGEIRSSKRVYTARGMPTTEAGILTRGFTQLYVSLGETSADGGTVVRIWWKPFVTLIWLGTVAMMAGAIVSLLDRRLRVGAPKAARRRQTPVPAE